MRNIHKGCLSQGVYYKTMFKYCKDYLISVNMWNFYSYCTFMLEKHWITIKYGVPIFHIDAVTRHKTGWLCSLQ